MKGFVVTLTPLDESGIQRNKDFMAKNKGKLVGGGRAVMDEKGVVVSTWKFPRIMPESAKVFMLGQTTNSLEAAIKGTNNVSFAVEILED